MNNINDLLRKVRNGSTATKDEIRYLVKTYVDPDTPDNVRNKILITMTRDIMRGGIVFLKRRYFYNFENARITPLSKREAWDELDVIVLDAMHQAFLKYDETKSSDFLAYAFYIVKFQVFEAVCIRKFGKPLSTDERRLFSRLSNISYSNETLSVAENSFDYKEFSDDAWLALATMTGVDPEKVRDVYGKLESRMALYFRQQLHECYTGDGASEEMVEYLPDETDHTEEIAKTEFLRYFKRITGEFLERVPTGKKKEIYRRLINDEPVKNIAADFEVSSQYIYLVRSELFKMLEEYLSKSTGGFVSRRNIGMLLA